MTDFFRIKFEYNFDCNTRIIDSMKANPAAYTIRAQTLMGHTLNAQNIWNNRILSLEPTQGVWEVFPLGQLAALNKSNHEQSLSLLLRFPMTHLVSYTNSEGKSYAKPFEAILFHIINHSTYHRGQLVSELKAAGLAPISTDYIFFNPNL